MSTKLYLVSQLVEVAVVVLVVVDRYMHDSYTLLIHLVTNELEIGRRSTRISGFYYTVGVILAIAAARYRINPTYAMPTLYLQILKSQVGTIFFYIGIKCQLKTAEGDYTTISVLHTHIWKHEEESGT